MPLPNKPGLPNQRPQGPGQGLPRPNQNPQQSDQRRPNNGLPQSQQRQDVNPVNPMLEPDFDEELEVKGTAHVDPNVAQAQLRDRLREVNKRRKPEPVVNQYDDENDDTFESLSIDEQLEYDTQEEEEQKRRDAKRQSAERRAKQQAERVRAERRKALEEEMNLGKPEPETEDINFDDTDNSFEDEISSDEDSSPENDEMVHEESSRKKKSNKKSMFEDNVKDEYGQDVFIDEKNGKLLPFGGKKSKKLKTKEHEYDERKNMRTAANITRLFIIAALVGLLGLGAKNTFFPEPQLSEDEIVATIQNTVNLTSFPLERGEGFATDFAQAYLSTDTEGRAINSSVLSYFYTGELTAEDQSESNRVIGSGYNQSVVYGPTVYESVALTDYSARYTIGAVVESSAQQVEGEEANAAVSQWIFLNVNVYYDVDTDKFTITPESPSILPTSSVGNGAELPAQQSLGEEVSDPEVIDRVQPVLYGFLNGYRESSADDHSTLDQYVVSNPPATLTQGLNSNYDFMGGSVENAVTYTVYTDPEDPNVMKVLTNVTWSTGINENSNIQMTSTYVATLQEQSNGMFLVAKFQPLYFVQDEEAAAAEQEAEAEENAEEATE